MPKQPMEDPISRLCARLLGGCIGMVVTGALVASGAAASVVTKLDGSEHRLELRQAHGRVQVADLDDSLADFLGKVVALFEAGESDDGDSDD